MKGANGRQIVVNIHFGSIAGDTRKTSKMTTISQMTQDTTKYTTAPLGGIFPDVCAGAPDVCAGAPSVCPRAACACACVGADILHSCQDVLGAGTEVERLQIAWAKCETSRIITSTRVREDEGCLSR